MISQRRSAVAIRTLLQSSVQTDIAPGESAGSSAASTGTVWTRLTRSAFGLAALGGILLWLAQPPVGLAPLAWLAPVPWVLLIAQPQLRARRLKRQLWMAMWMYWLVSLYFIPIPHPLLWIGWPLLAAYEATIYLAFFLISRHLVIERRLTPYLVVPAVWTGLEWLRTQTEYGFGMLSLSHTQFRWPIVIQIADLAGAYGLSLAMMVTATGLALAWRAWRGESERGTDDQSESTASREQAVHHRPATPLHGETGTTFSPRRLVLPLLIAAAPPLLSIAYGWYKLAEVEPSGEVIRRALIIQSSIDTVFPKTQAEWETEQRRRFLDMHRLTIAAREKHPEADVVFWPESGFLLPLSYDRSEDRIRRAPPSNRAEIEEYLFYATQSRATEADPSVPPLARIELISGVGAIDTEQQRQFGSVWQSTTFDRYDKNVRVPFGEFIPILEWFPSLARFSPFGVGLSRGQGPRPFRLAGIETGDEAASAEKSARMVTLLPSICFESLVPQLIRRHVVAVEHGPRGQHVDWLANFTDDGWFFGTSCLDLHLACTVFRAVEVRKPVLVAANTGFSAEIDHRGRLRQTGPRRAEGSLLVELTTQPRRYSLYLQTMGDWPWRIAAVFTVWGLVSSVIDARRGRRK